MLDTNSITALVEQEIVRSVNKHVDDITSDKSWQTGLEDRITKYVQDRIAARFANISTLAGLTETIQNSVTTLFDQGRVPGIETFVDTTKVTQAVDSAVQSLVASTIDNLILDQNWINKIETQVNLQMTQRLSAQISSIDINSLLVGQIDNGIERWQDRLKKDFKTQGITDTATGLQLTVNDNGVTVAKKLTATNIDVETDITIGGSLVVNNLAVRGVVNVDNTAWDEVIDKTATKALNKITEDWKQALVSQVLELSKSQGIDFSEVLVNGQPLVTNNQLSPVITDTHIQTVGVLRELDVAGPAEFNDTLAVANKRVGINTKHPEMALTVWDEETTVIVGKLAKDTAYIGTARPGTLSLGVNRGRHLSIEPDGLVVAPKLRIDRWRISHSNSVPGWSGTRGDLVLNNDPQPNAPFAWVCLGAFQWNPLRAV
jgi:hypothetical protein